MCLVLLENKPKMAVNPILVYKILEEIDAEKPLKTIKETPFQYMRVKFKHRKTTLESKICVYKGSANNSSIHESIHAFRDMSFSELVVRELDNHRGWGMKTYYAVIPKGATYYIGTNCDVATNKLIVFLTKEDFEKSEYAKDYKVFENYVPSF